MLAKGFAFRANIVILLVQLSTLCITKGDSGKIGTFYTAMCLVLDAQLLGK